MGRSSPEKVAQYAAQYRHTPNGAAARKRAQDRYYGSDKWREAHRRGMAAYRARSKERRSAHNALQDAVRYGKIVRPDVCESCGSLGLTVGHHHNGYGTAHQLDVRWLCGPCHRATHPVGKPKKVPPLSADLLNVE